MVDQTFNPPRVKEGTHHDRQSAKHDQLRTGKKPWYLQKVSKTTTAPTVTTSVTP